MFSKELAMPYHNLEWFEYMNTESRLQEGISLHQEGKLDQAELIYQQILQVNPENDEVLNLLGLIAYQIGKYQIATELINQAIDMDSSQSSFFNNLGLVLQKQDRLGEAIQAYRQSLELNPNDADIYSNFGTALKEQGQLEEAIDSYNTAIEIQSDHKEVYYNLGIALKKQGQLEEAIQVYYKAIDITPNNTKIYNNLGNIYQEQDRLEDAVYMYQKAIKIQPRADIYNNLGIALKEQGQLEEAIQVYYKAIEIQPQFANAQNNIGLILFLQGDFKNGWQQYQWRWKCDDFPSENRPFHQPSWNGSNPSAKTILVWAEQGIGDEIMFASMLNDLRQSNANIMVECEQRLISLFQRSFPDIRFFCRTNPPDQQLLNPNIDYQISMGSLGQWLRTDLDSFKQGQSYYLTACPDKTAELRNKYQQLASGRKLVGISWKSTDISQRRAKSKSTSLEYWASVLSQPNCYFINLQYGDIETEVAKFESDTNLKVYQDKEIDPLVNLDGFAAQISALDLVISTSNTTVHMAGALGKRVWTLLPHIPDWRWTLDREDALWYPAMRLFRQSSIGDWQDVFKRVSHALSQSGMV